MELQFLAGAALGLLLGLLVGLSSSPVVGTVVAAVASGMLVLLGFAPTAQSTDVGTASRAAGWRLSGFGLTCTVALLVGLFIRTHNLLTPKLKDQIGELTSAGFTADEAHSWTAYKNVGLLMRASSDMLVNKESRAAASASSYLFASPDTNNCALFSPEKYATPTEHLSALHNAGGKFAAFADSIAHLDSESRNAVLNSNKLLFCP